MTWKIHCGTFKNPKHDRYGTRHKFLTDYQCYTLKKEEENEASACAANELHA